MKKIIITLSILLSTFIIIVGFFYIRYINLDTYQWDSDNDMITYKNKQYTEDFFGTPSDFKLEKQIGKIEGGGDFRIWSIKGENIDDRIAINGFMFPPIVYRRIK